MYMWYIYVPQGRTHTYVPYVVHICTIKQGTWRRHHSKGLFNPIMKRRLQYRNNLFSNGSNPNLARFLFQNFGNFSVEIEVWSKEHELAFEGLVSSWSFISFVGGPS